MRILNSRSVQAGDISVQVIPTERQAMVTISGRVTIDSSPHMRQLLLRLVASESGTTVVIDISKVSYLDSSGLATLMETLRAAREHSVRLRLAGASGAVRMLFELIELPKIFSDFGSEVVFT